MIYKRGKKNIYWYRFMWRGTLIRQSTHQTNDKVARDQESTHHARLVKEEDARKAACTRLKCSAVLLCDECEKWFDADEARREGTRVFCSASCNAAWTKRHTKIPTLAHFAENRFLPWVEATFAAKPKTLLWYRNGVRRLKECEGIAAVELDKIAGEQIAGYVAYRQSCLVGPKGSDGKKKKNLEVSSINRELQVLRRILRVAVEWGVIERTCKVRMLPGEKHREFVLKPGEEARYLAAAPEPLGSVATVLADTGLRPEECYRLRWEALSWSAGRNGTLLVTHGKTAAARRLLPMTLRVRTLLETRWERAGKPAEGWVWSAPTKSGHIEASSLKKQHARTLATVNIEAAKNHQTPLRAFVLYSFRHTFLTRLGESGCDVWTLARIAGHSTIAISSRYVHPSADAVMLAMGRLGGHNSGHKQTDDTQEGDSQPKLTAGEETR
jgi:integrase